MCFSANASFGAGAVLSVIGVTTVARVTNSRQVFFAAIPFLFGIQQIIEGFTWLNFMHTDYAGWQSFSVKGFLFFAHILWPVWIPLSMLVLEEKPFRKRILQWILGIALLLSASELYCLVIYPADADIAGHHIEYTIHYPKIYAMCTEAVYVIVTLIPCFLSGKRKMWMFGISLTITLLLSAVFFKLYLVSVWCFFAAITSGVVYYILLQNTQNEKFNLKMQNT